MSLKDLEVWNTLRGILQAVFLLTAAVVSFSVPAKAQNLEGSYTTAGRRCEDSRLFVPIDGSIEEMTFSEGGLFQHITTTTDDGEITLEEYVEEIRTNAQKRYDDDVESHERACKRSDGEILNEDNENICEKSEKQKMYDRWWSEIVDPVEQEIEEIEADHSEGGVCQMTLTGDWSVQGERLTVQSASFTATSACGNEDSPNFRSITVDYYFEDGFLYLAQPPNRHSQEFCGNSDWAEIYIKK